MIKFINHHRRLLSTFFFSAFLFTFGARISLAAIAIVPEAGKELGNYGLNDLVQVGINLSQFIFSL